MRRKRDDKALEAAERETEASLQQAEADLAQQQELLREEQDEVIGPMRAIMAANHFTGLKLGALQLVRPLAAGARCLAPDSHPCEFRG